MAQQCDNCFYHRSAGSSDCVACHRYPPTITKAEGHTVTSYFPLVVNEGWCGEYLDMARQLNGPTISSPLPFKPRRKQ